MLGAVLPISFFLAVSHTDTHTAIYTLSPLLNNQYTCTFAVSLSRSPSLSVFLYIPLCPDTLIKGSRRALAQTTGCMLLLINAIKHPAHRGLFIAEMNCPKVQQHTGSFLQLPHYSRRPCLRQTYARLHLPWTHTANTRQNYSSPAVDGQTRVVITDVMTRRESCLIHFTLLIPTVLNCRQLKSPFLLKQRRVRVLQEGQDLSATN